jgi:hypothetical protein
MRDNQEGGGCSDNIEKAPIGPPGTIKKFGSAARLFRPSKKPRIIPPREKPKQENDNGKISCFPLFPSPALFLKKSLCQSTTEWLKSSIPEGMDVPKSISSYKPGTGVVKGEFGKPPERGGASYFD